MTDSWWKSFPAVVSAVQEQYEAGASSHMDGPMTDFESILLHDTL